jgi:7-cyano-7-deazaguanine synthase
MKNAVVLLSGGLDSTTTLAIARSEGFDCFALSFDYGQRHQVELEASRRVAKALGVKEHRVTRLDPALFRGSALTDDVAVPKRRTEEQIGQCIPVTYVPCRNLIFLSFAVAWAEVIPATDIFLGINALDYSGYPDCRPEFISAFENLVNLGTKAGQQGARFKIHAPLVSMTKAEIVHKAIDLGVDLSLTHSCYDPSPDGVACGECDACLLRQKGFKEAGHRDPIAYAAG